MKPLRIAIDILCAFAVITAVASCLIGYGESRAARHCAVLVQDSHLSP